MHVAKLRSLSFVLDIEVTSILGVLVCNAVLAHMM